MLGRITARLVMVAVLAVGLAACRGSDDVPATATLTGTSGATSRPTSVPPVTRLAATAQSSPTVATPGTPATANCAVTPYAPGTPPGSENDRALGSLSGLTPWYGGDGLWAFPWIAGEPPGTLYLNADGSHKVLWWREPGVRGAITVTARRLDGPTAPIEVDFEGSPTQQGQQPGGLRFPTPGCWEITGTAGGKRLTFVALVVPRPTNSTATPSR